MIDTSRNRLPELMSLDGATRDKEDVRAAAARGEFEELQKLALFNRTSIVSERYCTVGDGVDSLEGHLHSLWHIYYQLGRHISHETPEHDSLALDIIRIQGLGTLTRPVQGVYGIDVARTVEGTLWGDVPFLVTDMAGFWSMSCASLSGTHRLNLASFLAKLASTRISKDGMCQIALILFRATFEEERELGTTDEPDHEDAQRNIKSLDIAHLLPSACAWIKEAGHNLIQLSEVSWDDGPRTTSQGGSMFVESELGKRSPKGFAPWRWMYWLKRLHEIRDEAKEAKEKQLEEYAADAIDLMVSNVRERNSEILKVYNAAGDLQKDEHLSCLGDQ
ncbi:hypothetical protein ISF_06300 [Cordyceps fumosorosea ARSEF 2679]|uniref:DUF3632 domain containing protein n=1 Tax=Cordyceps fumosorosea (strain ARSEF 2679) TaxID=1081104 RepID=A0A167S8H9_CORFA|nr:hypothetical protein ISF_06300 [Cordyceps fumosorosea ARSEF 2679]OAA59365.1 hypothetical protein ISF_06300 [Cordyceps fumosorosea ARSEF 2679]